MKKQKALMTFIVDDDPIYSKLLEISLKTEIPEMIIKTFPTGEACLHSMNLNPDFVILDYMLNSEHPDAWDGIRVLKKLSWNYPYTTTIMLSSQQNIETAMNTIHEGAFEYIVKNEKAFDKIKNIILDLAEVLDERNAAGS